MSDHCESSVTGNWFGNYYYADLSHACAFEAVFAQQGAAVEGSILDDGQLGEARVAGSFAGGQIAFHKIYNNGLHQVVNYQGVLSDDGKALAGTWRINEYCHGQWKAWRMDGEELPELTEQTETDAEATPERELVPVRTKPVR